MSSRDSMSHLDERPLFSDRYGRSRRAYDRGTVPELMAWTVRHQEVIEPDSRHRCICPGTCPPRESDVQPCGMRATQEDFLCNECRQWCVAIDDHGNYHQFASRRFSQ